MARIVAIWFPYLITDQMIRRQPELKDVPFALVTKEKGRRIVKSVNKVAQKKV